MNNAELIKALRRCSYMTVADELNEGYCKPCAYYTGDSADVTCIDRMMIDAADALETISKTVIPHRNYENCRIYWCDCGWFLRNEDQTPNYCPNCGKRIEWSDAE